MHLPRLRLRTLLIAVAVMGVGLGGWTMWKRREYCLNRAAEHARLAGQLQDSAAGWDNLAEQNRKRAEEVRDAERQFGISGLPVPDWDKEAEEDARRAALFHRNADANAQQAARYRRAANFPWPPIPPEMKPYPYWDDAP